MTIKIYHTSPEEIKEIREDGLFGDVFFWAPEPYFMAPTVKAIYEIELDDNEIIKAHQLYDHEIIEKISERANVDLEIAESFLNGSINEFKYFDDEFTYNNPNFDIGDFSWFLQKCRGYAARKMGFIACKDADEQGTVYLIRMKDVFKRTQLCDNDLLP